MTGTFRERLDQLAREVGKGDLEVRVVVDQVYAKYQERRFDLHHPRGGQAFYLKDTVVGGAFEHMRSLASSLLTRDGSDIRGGARRLSEDFVRGVYTRAPVEYGPLKDSGHPTVTDDGVLIYDRPPVVARLSDAELRALRRNPGAASLVPGARQTGLPRPR